MVRTQDEFWANVDKRGEDDCWPYRYDNDHTDWEERWGQPYTYLWYGGYLQRVQRLAWMFEHGESLQRAHLYHDNSDGKGRLRNCCNPKHWKLEQEDPKKRAARAERRKREASNKRKEMRNGKYSRNSRSASAWTGEAVIDG